MSVMFQKFDELFDDDRPFSDVRLELDFWPTRNVALDVLYHSCRFKRSVTPVSFEIVDGSHRVVRPEPDDESPGTGLDHDAPGSLGSAAAARARPG